MGVDRRLSLHKLEVLSAVVRAGGVSKAAESLFVAQPVVSAHIRTLEERLGAKLFYREGRQMHLTEAGVAVHAWAEDVLVRTRELERYLDGLQDGRQGTIVLGASMSVGSYRLPSVLTAFRGSHPDVEVRMGISDTEHAVDDVRSGAFDFAVVVAATSGDLPGLDAEEIGEDHITLVAAPDHPLAGRTVSVDDLRTLPFIEAPEGIIRRTFVDRQLRGLGIVQRNVVLQLGHPEAMKRATQDGLGVALLFRSAVQEELRAGTLCELPVDGVDLAVPVFVVARKGKTFSPVHRALIDEIRAAMAAAQPA
jgi:LysR family transcriptional regulator, low CO2-responsive transcriptional regulator